MTSELRNSLNSLACAKSALRSAYLISVERPGWCLASDAGGLAIEVTEIADRPSGTPSQVVLSIDVGPSYRFSSGHVVVATAAAPASQVLAVNERLVIRRVMRYGQCDGAELVAAIAELGRGAAEVKRAQRSIAGERSKRRSRL